MLKIFELIETRARRGEQYRVAAAGAGISLFDRHIDGPATNQRDRAAQLRLDLSCRRADQQRRVRLRLEGLREQGVIAVLVLAAENDPQAAGKSMDRLQRRVDVGRLRVVVPRDSAEVAHEFEPMLDAGKRHDSGSDLLV